MVGDAPGPSFRHPERPPELAVLVGRLVVLLEPREELADPLVVAEFVGAGERRHCGPQIVDIGGADDLPGEGDSQAAVRLLAAVVTDATFVELFGVGAIEDGELERGRGPEQGIWFSGRFIA